MASSRIAGCDSYSQVTEALVTRAADLLGQTPNFWGRYFTSRNTLQGAEYRHAVENPILSPHGIRVLPVARQTAHVSGSFELGYADGVANAQDLLATFPGLAQRCPRGVRIFLDVEGSPATATNPPSILSDGYYGGWVKGLADGASGMNLLPCVYGIPGDANTWNVIRRQTSLGLPCGGVWLSHPYLPTSCPAEPVAWDGLMLRPFEPIANVPVQLWQYCFDDNLGFDRNQLNPDVDAGQFLDTLVPVTGT